MKVLGIDPGYDRLGVAVVEKTQKGECLLYSTCIETDSSLSFHDRLSIIGEAIRNIIAEHEPDQLSIEKTFFGKNKKTAVAVSEARGVVVYEATQAGLPITEYSPPQIKVATTGYGASTKKQVAFMVEHLVKVKKKIEHDDEYDAIAVALTHLSSSHPYR